MKRLLTLCFLLSLAGAAQAQNWPSFRGPNTLGIADGQQLPVEFSAEDKSNILWMTSIPGLAHSSPIVWGDRVFVTTAINTEGSPEVRTGDSSVAGSRSLPGEGRIKHSWRLYSINKNTGKILWSKTVHEGTPRITRHPKASHASATPATNGKYIVGLFGSEGLFCFDMDGKLMWKKDLGVLDQGYWTKPQYSWGPASSPVIYKNMVIIQNDKQQDSFLAAYALETGEEVWNVERDEKPAWSTPAVYQGDRPELVVNSANYFYGYDPMTGKELWRFSNEDRQVISPSPVIVDGVAVITGAVPTGSHPIHAIRLGGNGDITPTDGETSSEFLAWKTPRWSPYTPTPLVYRDIVYVVVDNGVLRAFDFQSGERLYQTRIAVGAAFSASPVASDGKVYFASEDGDVYVVKAGKEYELLAANPVGEALMATPAISGDILLVRGRNHLYAVGTSKKAKKAASTKTP
jgi:outer membrane protein assembly factor BamB